LSIAGKENLLRLRIYVQYTETTFQ